MGHTMGMGEETIPKHNYLFHPMRSLAIYFGFLAVAVSITTYTVDGMVAGLESARSERNAQIEAVMAR